MNMEIKSAKLEMVEVKGADSQPILQKQSHPILSRVAFAVPEVSVDALFLQVWPLWVMITATPDTGVLIYARGNGNTPTLASTARQP
jgi:hypothetical protein